MLLRSQSPHRFNQHVLHRQVLPRSARKAGFAQPGLDLHRAVEHPFPVAFLQWICWADCIPSHDLNWPGVYVLAVFTGNAPSAVDLESNRICYIGSACERPLGWELQQFKYRCPAGLDIERCERVPLAPAETARLWVAVFPVTDMDEPQRSAFIHHVEREMLWKWVSKNGRLPDCNIK